MKHLFSKVFTPFSVSGETVCNSHPESTLQAHILIQMNQILRKKQPVPLKWKSTFTISKMGYFQCYYSMMRSLEFAGGFGHAYTYNLLHGEMRHHLHRQVTPLPSFIFLGTR